MYLDREWRIPQPGDSPIRWPGEAAWMAVFSPYCCGWHVTGIGQCYTDPMGLLVTYGNDWEWVPLESIEHEMVIQRADGTLTATGLAGLQANVILSL